MISEDIYLFVKPIVHCSYYAPEASQGVKINLESQDLKDSIMLLEPSSHFLLSYVVAAFLVNVKMVENSFAVNVFNLNMTQYEHEF